MHRVHGLLEVIQCIRPQERWSSLRLPNVPRCPSSYVCLLGRGAVHSAERELHSWWQRLPFPGGKKSISKWFYFPSLDFTRVIYVCWQNMICTWLALIITNTCSSPKSAVKGQHPPSWEVPHFSVEFHPPNVFVPETHWKTMMGVRKLDVKADQSLISLIRKPFLLCHGTRPSVGLNLNDDISCDFSLLKPQSVFW